MRSRKTPRARSEDAGKITLGFSCLSPSKPKAIRLLGVSIYAHFCTPYRSIIPWLRSIQTRGCGFAWVISPSLAMQLPLTRCSGPRLLCGMGRPQTARTCPQSGRDQGTGKGSGHGGSSYRGRYGSSCLALVIHAKAYSHQAQDTRPTC